MKARSTGLWGLAALVCVLGCGGKLSEGSESGENGDGLSGGGGSSGATGAGAAKPGSSPGTTALGPCHLGFAPDEEPTRACDWLARGLCYETKLEACNCICPVNRQDSVCSSGWDNGPNGKTEVKCY